SPPSSAATALQIPDRSGDTTPAPPDSPADTPCPSLFLRNRARRNSPLRTRYFSSIPSPHSADVAAPDRPPSFAHLPAPRRTQCRARSTWVRVTNTPLPAPAPGAPLALPENQTLPSPPASRPALPARPIQYPR